MGHMGSQGCPDWLDPRGNLGTAHLDMQVQRAVWGFPASKGHLGYQVRKVNQPQSSQCKEILGHLAEEALKVVLDPQVLLDQEVPKGHLAPLARRENLALSSQPVEDHRD